MDDKRFRELIEKWRKEADPPYTDTIPLSSPAMARCIALIQCAKQLESALAAESGETPAIHNCTQEQFDALVRDAMSWRATRVEAPPASQPDEFDKLAEKLDHELIVGEDSVSSHSRRLIAAELRRVAVQEAEWWHKRCCERVEVIGHPGVFQCFGCERIAKWCSNNALERAAKEEKR